MHVARSSVGRVSACLNALLRALRAVVTAHDTGGILMCYVGSKAID